MSAKPEQMTTEASAQGASKVGAASGKGPVVSKSKPLAPANNGSNFLLSALYWGRDNATSLAIRTLAIVFALVVWHIAATQEWNWVLSFANVPPPAVVGTEFLAQLQNDQFYTHIGVSLQRILISYVLAVGLGVLTGTLMGRSRLVTDFCSPYIEILRPIPAVAWIPLAILIMPTEESSIIFITFLGAFFPIVLNTVHGVQQTSPVLVRAARSLGASNAAILRHVVLPGALPSISAGLAIGMGVAWFSLLAGEIISGQYGIGYFTWAAYTLIEYPKIIIGMLVIGGLGTLSTLLIRQMMSPLLRWQKAGARA